MEQCEPFREEAPSQRGEKGASSRLWGEVVLLGESPRLRGFLSLGIPFLMEETQP